LLKHHINVEAGPLLSPARLGGSFLSDAAGGTDNRKQKKGPMPASLRFIHAADFFQEAFSFRKQTDTRPAFSNLLKERGFSEDACALSSLTDTDVGAILPGACRLFSDELASLGEEERKGDKKDEGA
jgi:hypothetical protein